MTNWVDNAIQLTFPNTDPVTDAIMAVLDKEWVEIPKEDFGRFCNAYTKTIFNKEVLFRNEWDVETFIETVREAGKKIDGKYVDQAIAIAFARWSLRHNNTIWLRTPEGEKTACGAWITKAASIIIAMAG